MKKTLDILCLNDFGEDVDDPVSIVFAKGLQDQSFLRLRGVICGTDPTDYRTEIGRGMLDRLNLRDLPLVAGRGRADEFWFRRTPWCSASRPLAKAEQLLAALFEQATDKSLTIVLMAPLGDLAAFIASERDLFVQKTAHVILMGGIEMQGDLPVRDEKQRLLPDTAKNLYFNKPAGDYVFRELQTLGVPLTVVTRFAAYAASMPLQQFRQLGSLGHEVGNWLVDGIDGHFDEFWVNCNLPLDHIVRLERKMPERQTADWFRKFILKGKGADRTVSDKIHDLVDAVPIYDALAIAAAVPELRDKYFDITPFESVNGTVDLIGLGQQCSGVKNGPGLCDYILETMTAALRQSLVLAPFCAPIPRSQAVCLA